MAAERPSLSSLTRSDEVDFVQFGRSHTHNPQARVVKNLVDNQSVGTKANSPKVYSHLLTAVKECQNEEIEPEDVSQFYLRFNRMRQEQNIFKKMSGPNYLEAILAKPKAKLPDINDNAIDATDDGGVVGEIEDNNDEEGAPEKTPVEGQRGTLKVSLDCLTSAHAIFYKTWELYFFESWLFYL